MSSCTTTSLMENVCRTCMREDGIESAAESKERTTVSIFYEQEFLKNKITLMELLMLTIPQLNIEKDDMLPKILCRNCVDELVRAHEFQQKCIRIEKRLKEIINKDQPIKEEKDANDPLNSGVVLTKNELDDGYEMDECILDQKEVSSDEIFSDVSTSSYDDCNYVPSSSNGDSDCESEFITSSNNNVIGDKQKEVENKNNIQNNVEIYEFKCDECGNRLKTSKSLKKHKLIHSRSQNNIEKTVNNEKSSYKFECDLCGSRIKTRKNLTRHKKIHLRQPGVQKKEEPKIKTKTINECEYCKKAFQKPSLLKDHIRIHTGELPYLCSECGKSFRKASVLKQHLLRHGTEKPHACTDCPKSFSTISDLASHKQVHTTTKPHVCDVCGACFVKAFYLKEHKMYHTGEKNHKCDYCDRRFVTGYQCRRHMRTHTGEKPHKCKYCDRAYTQRNELMKHLRIHLGDNVYKCSLCPQGFPCHAELCQHFNTHKDDDEETKQRNLEALDEEELRLDIKFGLVDGT